MNIVTINANEPILLNGTILGQIAASPQSIANNTEIGLQILITFLGVVAITAVCIYICSKFFNSKLWFDRLLSKNLWWHFAILGLALIVIFLLSWLFLHISGCKWSDFCKHNNLSEWLLPLYLLIDSNALNNLYIHSVNGWALFVSSAIYVVGMFVFNGMIISIMTNALEQRVNKHKEGFIHYLKSGHYIIMGYDDMVPSFISYIFEKDKDAYVLVLTSAETIGIREKLLKSFSMKQMERIIINYGHRVSPDAYKDIHLESAEQIYIVGNHVKPAHDAINVECVDSICSYLEQPEVTERPNRIVCVFKDLDTYAAFKTSEIFGKVEKLGVEFFPYNFYTGWAKQVFIKRKYKDFDHPENTYSYPSLYGNKGVKADDDRYVHLVFVGTTNFAVAFAMEAAHIMHFPNADKAKTRITFIDKNADKEKDEFIIRNRHFFEIQPYLYQDLSSAKDKEPQGTRYECVVFKGKDANFLDVEFEFIKGDVFSKAVQDVIDGWAQEHNKKQFLSIFLAMSDQRQNFVMGMNMPDLVYDNEVPLFIRQDRSDNFVTNLRKADIKSDEEKLTYSTVNENGVLDQQKRDARYANIYPFGMNETAYCADEHSLKRAKLINYLYNTMPSDYQFQSIMALNTMTEEKIWEEADEYWRKLTVALKWSNLYCAYAIITKLDSLRAMRGLKLDDTSRDYDSLNDDEIETLAKVEHNRWNVEKLLMGFRKPKAEEDKYEHKVFEDVIMKNKKLFIHHDIRPFEDLGSIKDLDGEFSRYIPWIMRMTED